MTSLLDRIAYHFEMLETGNDSHRFKYREIRLSPLKTENIGR